MALRLVLADDHPLIREGLRASLSDQGFTVVAEADNGTAAVDLALEHRPDVVVIDIEMPGLDGLEATRRIVRARPMSRVLVLTGHEDEASRQAAKDAGAKAYLAKSASTQEITDAVRALARGESLMGKVDPKNPRKQSIGQIDDYFKRRGPNADPVLTKREREVIQLFANGSSTVEVARTLTISQKTVKNHLTSIYQKLNVRDRTEAVLLAVRMGIINLERRKTPRE